MSPQLQEDAREAPRALGIAQQDNSDLRALEVRVSELATDFRGLTRSLARERQRTAALRIEQEARESWGNRIPSISAFPSASSRPPSPWQQNTSPQAAGLSDGVPPPPAPMPSVYSSYVPSGATQSSINPPPAPPAPTHSAGDGFELYECDACGELQAVRVGRECSHVCGGATEDSDASDDEDGECNACGQLAAWCVCGQEWGYGADLSACDEQLPPGVYRDEDGTLHDEDDGSYGVDTLGAC